MAQAVHVRRALLDDPALGPLNLGVEVHDGAVVLVGPVPTSELAQQALRKVAQVRGVLQVRSELYLSRDTSHEPITLPLSGEAPTQTQSASPGSTSGSLGTLTGRVPPIELPPSGRSATVQPSSPSAPEAPPASPRTAAPASPPARGQWATAPQAGSGVSLLAPVLDAPQTPRPPAAAESLASAVERVRQSDARFRGIRVEVRGATVLLSGPEVPGEHVMALAQALSVLPGLQRVLVQNSPSPER
jgi:hypothetical protein